MSGSGSVLEHSLYVGNVFAVFLTGMQAVLCIQSVHYLWNRKSNYKVSLSVYSFVLLVLQMFAFIANQYFGQLMWIDYRDVTGGPLAYFMENITLWSNTFGTASDAMASVLGDSLLLYRCYMFYREDRWVAILPTLLFLASTAMAIVSTVQSALPGDNLFGGSTANFLLCWVALSVSFNILVTIIICARLLIAHSRLKSLLGTEDLKTYTGVVAILVESALPLSITGIAFVVSIAKNSETEIAFACVWGTFATLAPQMIIYRVASGTGWNRTTIGQFSERPIFALRSRNADADVHKLESGGLTSGTLVTELTTKTSKATIVGSTD